MGKEKVAVYYRVSSKKQARTQNIDTQREQMEPWLQEKKYDITEFVDNGITGDAFEERPKFVELMQRIQKGEFKILCVYMIDRVGRFSDRSKRTFVVKTIEDNEVFVDTLYDGSFNPKSEDDMDDFERMLSDARRENRRRTLRVIDGQKRALKQGRPGTRAAPYGVQWVWIEKDRKIGEFRTNQIEYDTLKEMHRMFCSGYSLEKVCDVLNGDRKKHPTKRGGQWNNSTVYGLWHNDFMFTGVLIRNKWGHKFVVNKETKKKEKKPYFRPEDEWIRIDTGIKMFSENQVREVNHHLSVRKVKQTKNIPKRFDDFLLQRIVSCGKCKIKLSVQYLTSRYGHVYRYYVCTNKHKKRCTIKTIRADKLDFAVWQRFITTLTDPEQLQKAVESQEFVRGSKRRDVEKQLKTSWNDVKKFKGQQNRLTEVYVEGDIDAATYKDKKEQIESNLNKAKRKRDNAQQSLEHPDKTMGAITEAAKALSETIRLLNKIHVPADNANREGMDSWNKYIAEKKMDWQMDWQEKWVKMSIEASTGIEMDDELRELIFQQKRQILAKFVGAGGQIRAWSDHKFEICGTISIDNSGSEGFGGTGNTGQTGNDSGDFVQISKPYLQKIQAHCIVGFGQSFGAHGFQQPVQGYPDIFNSHNYAQVFF